MGLAATVVISGLIGAQLIILACLACFIYRVPTWSTVLNAFAMATVGASLGPQVFSSIGPANKDAADQIKDRSGLIGIVVADETNTNAEAGLLKPEAASPMAKELSECKTEDGVSSSPGMVQLGLAASGPIERTTRHEPLRYGWAGRHWFMSLEPPKRETKRHCNNCSARRFQKDTTPTEDDSSS